jgi:hypothetical protein
MESENLFKLFNITVESEDKVVEESYNKLLKKLVSKNNKAELLKKYKIISSEELRYIYFLTSTKGFQDISELDREIISRPNYIGPRKWLELLER